MWITIPPKTLRINDGRYPYAIFTKRMSMMDANDSWACREINVPPEAVPSYARFRIDEWPEDKPNYEAICRNLEAALLLLR